MDMRLEDELLEKARSMTPILAQRADEDDRNGATRKETMDELVRLGLTRVTQPKRWGGYEQPLRVVAQIEIALARGDQSASWSYAVTQGHAHHLALFDDRAQQDVWGENPEVLIASPYNPLGKAATHKDGYKLQGRWNFSSACDHCDWFLLGAFADGDPAKFLTFLVPRRDVKIIDDWNVYGLKGTGSKSLEVAETFVPGYRTVPFGPASENFEFPGLKVNTGVSYRVPYMIIFNRAITATSIGGLAGMIDAAVAYLGPKVSIMSGKPVTDLPDALLVIGQAAATLDELIILALHDFNKLEEMAAANYVPTEEEQNMFRYRAQECADRCVTAGRALFEAAGGNGLYEKLPLGRIYRNLVASRAHPAAGMFRESARSIAVNLLGRAAEKRLRF